MAFVKISFEEYAVKTEALELLDATFAQKAAPDAQLDAEVKLVLYKAKKLG